MIISSWMRKQTLGLPEPEALAPLGPNFNVARPLDLLCNNINAHSFFFAGCRGATINIEIGGAGVLNRRMIATSSIRSVVLRGEHKKHLESTTVA